MGLQRLCRNSLISPLDFVPAGRVGGKLPDRHEAIVFVIAEEAREFHAALRPFLPAPVLDLDSGLRRPTLTLPDTRCSFFLSVVSVSLLPSIFPPAPLYLALEMILNSFEVIE